MNDQPKRVLYNDALKKLRELSTAELCLCLDAMRAPIELRGSISLSDMILEASRRLREYERVRTCGKCGQPIKADPLTGTVCACSSYGDRNR
jgi:hypothetical protein